MSEVVDLLQRLVQVDTVNPPGNETARRRAPSGVPRGQRRRLRAVREGARAGEPGRAHPGRSGGPRLLLLSHTDTVLADPEEWSVDPWSGEVEDGHVWGRGALDMKGQVAAGAVAIASLAREGFEPAGDLIFVAAADEEVGEGEQFGLAWLVDAHPEAVEAEYALNEGAGDRIEIAGTPLLLLLDRGEDGGAVHHRGPRPERSRFDAGDRGQRAGEGRSADRAARRVQASARARPGGRGAPSDHPRRGAADRAGGRALPQSCTREPPRWSSRSSP